MKEDQRRIAVIGFAGRFPGAPSAEALWQASLEARDCITRFSREELVAAGRSAILVDDPRYVPANGMLADAEHFDAEFFGISPAEARIMDPQQRVFIETAAQSLDHAGYGVRPPAAPIGVFAGASLSTYLLCLLDYRHHQVDVALDLPTLIGNDKDHLTTRVAYCLDLAGPTVSVQTACSTSLTATHLAIRSLREGECELALAGGVSIGVPQTSGYIHVEGSVSSSDGRCRAFDQNASGLVGGCGVGIVVLKRLDAALRDEDPIHAVLLGSAIGNDGHQKLSYSAPSIVGQSRAIAAALSDAAVAPHQLGLIEAHGTGTVLGDLIEIGALREVLGEDLPLDCVLGALKPNIGHLDAAAGVASLIKAICSVRDGERAPTLHFESPKPELEIDASHLRIAETREPWSDADGPRRAGVSAFGIGGANAHVVIEQPPSIAPRPAPNLAPQALLWTARAEAALSTYATSLAETLDDTPLDLDDTAYTLRTTRATHPFRAALVAGSRVEAVKLLRGGDWASATPSTRATVFLFSGQGTPIGGLGRDLEALPSFADAFDACAERFNTALNIDLWRVLHRAETNAENTVVVQPMIFSLGYALAAVWRAAGVEPAAVLGHSLGEIAAACVAGALDLEAAVTLVSARARLMAAVPEGAMLSVVTTETQLATTIDEAGLPLDIAGVNGPRLTVAAGTPEAVVELESILKSREIVTKRLSANRAFHSRAMSSVARELDMLVPQLAIAPLKVPLVCGVNGALIAAGESLAPDYWARQVRSPTRLADAYSSLSQFGPQHRLELGYGEALSRLSQLQHGVEPIPVATSLPSNLAPNDPLRGLLKAATNIWLEGTNINWDAISFGRTPRRVSLPGYAFLRQRHWLDTGTHAGSESNVGKTPEPEESATTRLEVPVWRCIARVPAQKTNSPKTRNVIALARYDDALTRALYQTLMAAGTEPILLDSESMVHGALVAGVDQLVVSCVMGDNADTLAASTRAVSVAAELRQWSGDCIPALTFVTCQGQAMGSRLTADPTQAMVAAIAKTAITEFPGINIGCVDVAGSEDAAVLAPYLLNRPRTGLSVLDGERIWAGSSAPLDPPTNATALAPKTGGVYLITGGSGAIGTAIGRHLQEQYNSKLAIISRNALGTSDKIRSSRLDALAAGGELMHLCLDIADESAVVHARQAIESQLGPINGVIHAAGIAGGSMLASAATDELARLCQPKVQGTIALAKAFCGAVLDFVVLCSSIAGYRGTPGQAAYGAANAFLDAVPDSGMFGHNPVVSIAWCAWRDGGMAVETPLPGALEAQRAQTLEKGVSQAQGVEIFSTALGSGAPRVIVGNRAPAKIQSESAVVLSNEKQSTVQVTPPAIPRKALDLPTCEAALREIWAQTLGLADITADTNVFKLGANSLTAIEVATTIESQLGLLVSPVAFYAAPTPRALAEAILKPTEVDHAVEAGAQRGTLRRKRS